MRTPLQARSVETRRRFAEAARTLFASHRYEDVTIRLISERAGRSASALFLYWRDKAAIWREVIGGDPPTDSPQSRSAPALLTAHAESIRRLDAVISQIDAGATMLSVRQEVGDVIALLRNSNVTETLQPLGPKVGAVDRDMTARPSRKSISLGDRDDLAVAIGKRIRDRRVALGLAQSDLSETLMVTSQQVHYYETGSSQLPSSSLHRLARALKCSPIDLLGPPAEAEGT